MLLVQQRKFGSCSSLHIVHYLPDFLLRHSRQAQEKFSPSYI